jgi:hypothetical protein
VVMFRKKRGLKDRYQPYNDSILPQVTTLQSNLVKIKSAIIHILFVRAGR